VTDQLELAPGLWLRRAVPIASITRRGSNHNKWSPAKLAGLVDAIKAGAFTSTVLLREMPGKLELVDGEHRVEAARIAGLDAVPALVYEPGACGDELALAKHIGHNVLRGDIDLAELGRQLLAAGGLTTPVVAGVSSEWVDSLLASVKPLSMDVDVLVDAALGVETDALLERTAPDGPAAPRHAVSVAVSSAADRRACLAALAELGEGDPGLGLLRALGLR